LIGAVREKFPHTPIVFTNMPPIKEFPAFTSLIKFTIGNLVELFGDEVEEEVKTYPNVHYYADRITIAGWSKRLNVKAERGDFFSDGVHPSKLTYQTWARDLGRWMVEEKGMEFT
jgi:lysophospholipase L1-like esterase